MTKLNTKALVLTLGIIWGAYMALLGWAASFGWGVKAVEVMSSIYVGYKATFLGGVVGGIYGFIDGAIAGLLIALLYNYFAKK